MSNQDPRPDPGAPVPQYAADGVSHREYHHDSVEEAQDAILGPAGADWRETVMPCGPFRHVWNGSAPQRGDHVWLGTERVAYLGDQYHDEVTKLVHAMNVAVQAAKEAACAPQS